MVSRRAVEARNSATLEALAADLRLFVDRLQAVAGQVLDAQRSGALGAATWVTTSSLFDLWCRQSLVATPGQARSLVEDHLRTRPHDVAGIAAILRGQCEVPRADAETAAAQCVSAWSASASAIALDEPIWSAYAATRRKFCAQTAHVLAARLLLYRVGEDRALWPERISGTAWATERGRAAGAPWPSPWVLSLIEQMRDWMRGLVPSVYERGEFDWWAIYGSHRAALAVAELTQVELLDDRLGNTLQDFVDTLDAYEFAAVDVDVWHDVYQHYLPSEERQRLGGFYTPDELVALMLSLAGWISERQDLCRTRLIDPACGSGTFLVWASRALLDHLDLPQPCHAELLSLKASWERARFRLERVADCIHGIDIHPFAAFLSTLNVLFVILDDYVAAKKHAPALTVDFAIFARDSLDKTKAEVIRPELWEAMNSRVALSEHSLHRFAEMADRKFDVIIGNPPWGGVLKGRLAPVFDAATKARYKVEYPAAARGKYDVYGLFLERGVGWLAPAGRLTLVTQNTYFDKEWAAGLRDLLAKNTTIRALVDLGPFGQLLFGAMNTPAIGVFDESVAGNDRNVVDVIRTEPPRWTVAGSAARRTQLIDSVASALARRPALSGTPSIARLVAAAQAELQRTAVTRWILDVTIPSPSPGTVLSILEVLEHRQGVTPGGVLDLFLLSVTQATSLGLEGTLVREAVKGRYLSGWTIQSQGRALLYPYVADQSGNMHPAFAITHTKVADALDLDVALDTHEATLRGRPDWVVDVIERRIAAGLVRFPAAARYLAAHYERLQSREFKGRNIRDFGRRWYEYLWPRDIALLSSVPRILSPSLIRAPRFAFDRAGYLSDHATIFLVRTPATTKRFEELRTNLSDAIGTPASDDDVFLYVLAQLNSPAAMAAIKAGRNPTPKGSYQLSEAAVGDVTIILKPGARQAGDLMSLASSEIAKTPTAVARGS